MTENKKNTQKECPCKRMMAKMKPSLQGVVKWAKSHLEIVAVVAVVLIVVFSSFFCSHSGTVAVLDVEKLRMESEAYQKIASEQQKYEEIWKIKFNAERGVLDQEDKELAASRKSMKPLELKRAVDALQQKAIGLQQKYQAEASKIVLATQMTAKNVDMKTIELVRDVAKLKGYSVVLPKTSTIYTNEDVDMTDTFIKELNKETIDVKYPNPDTLNLPKGK